MLVHGREVSESMSESDGAGMLRVESSARAVCREHRCEAGPGGLVLTRQAPCMAGRRRHLVTQLHSTVAIMHRRGRTVPAGPGRRSATPVHVRGSVGVSEQ